MVDFGSTGKIMLQIAETARQQGMQMQTFSTRQQSLHYRKLPAAPQGHTYYGSFLGNNLHYILSRITGKYGCYSRFSTRKLIRQLKAFGPDLIHLHNLHSAFLNLPMLFRYIKKNHIPVVWTLHDCWPFTGKCTYFDIAACSRWKTGCHTCPQLHSYPQSMLDSSRTMWHSKQKWYTDLENLILVTPSQWLADLAKQSFLQNAQIRVINNGIDLSVFKPTQSDFREKYNCRDKFILLGVAFGWGKRKGLDVFLELAKCLDDSFQIVLVGTDARIDETLPENILSIHRTRNQQELAQIYSAADLFVNPTREENYPTVNMEALACGTPVLTFRTGGSPEILDETCGSTVDCDDLQELIHQIQRIKTTAPYPSSACLERSKNFAMHQRFYEYLELYKNIQKNKQLFATARNPKVR